MVNTLALAKLSFPETQGAIPRERLFALLDRRADYPVVWISGPPGSGKSTLVASYLQTFGVPASWYQVNGEDKDPAATFAWLRNLGDSVGSSKAKDGFPYLTSEFRADIERFAVRFFRALFSRMHSREVLVFDNCHEAAGSQFDAVLRYAANEVPRGLTLVFISRMRPPPELARLVLGRQLMEITWEDLKCSSDESRRVVRSLGTRDLGAERIHRLTQGWMAGLVLLAAGSDDVAWSDSGMTPDHQELLFDYFSAEVFDRMDSALQDVLLATSLFKDFDLEMAAEISGNQQAGRILLDFHRRKYFMNAKGSPHSTYQYHDLFKRFLMSQVERRWAQERLDRLRASAAQILLNHGRATDAIELQIEGKQWKALGDALRSHGDAALVEGRWETLQRWMGAVPDATIAESPALIYWKAMSRLHESPEESRRLFERAATQYEVDHDVAGRLEALAGLIEAAIYRHSDLGALRTWVGQVTELLSQSAVTISITAEAQALSACVLAGQHLGLDADSLSRWSERLLQIYESGGAPSRRLELAPRILYGLALGADQRRGQRLLALIDPEMSSADVRPLSQAWWNWGASRFFLMFGKVDLASSRVDRAIQVSRECGIRTTLVQSLALKLHLEVICQRYLNNPHLW